MKPAIIAIILTAAIIGVGATYLIKSSPNSSNNTTPTATNEVVPTQSAVSTPSATAQVSKSYTLVEIAKHKTKSDCWMAVSGNVYDVTSFIPGHPGGDDILKGCGKDATKLFTSEREHGQDARDTIKNYMIGSLTS